MPNMPSTTASPPPETYSPYLTDHDDADSAVEVKQNVAQAPPAIKPKPVALQRVREQPIKERAAALDKAITDIRGLGLHLVFARELLHVDAAGGRS